jgi:ribosome-associated protein
MDIRKLQRAIVDGLEDVKGQNIVVFNTEHLSPLFERVIIASGTSNRQTKALASSVRDAVKHKGFGVMRTEGEDNGEWIIVDCGAAVVHVMQPAIRDYYHLEEIWGEKPVKMKIDDKPVRLVKSENEDEPAKKATAKTAAKSAVKKAPAKKAAAKSAPARAAPAKAPVAKKVAAKKVAAKSAPAKRAAAPKPGVTRTVGVKSAASKTTTRAAPATKTAAKKAPAKKAAAKKTASRA